MLLRTLGRATAALAFRPYRCSAHTTRLLSTDSVSSDGEALGLDNQGDRVAMETHQSLLENYNLVAMQTQRVFVVQPFVRKIGFRYVQVPTEERRDHNLNLEESLGLVDTLGWTVVDKSLVGLSSYERPFLFGSGNLDMLREKIGKALGVSMVFVSTYRLTSRQRLNLEATFERPVVDRYNLILQIFQRHARTKEARLQVALAEIPYLKSRLHGDMTLENEKKHSSDRKGDDYYERREMHLKAREERLKSQLQKIKQHREVMRKQRRELKIPSVAVVGYTNCGKTSLIKALTNGDLEPRDKLFATLDVTVHEAVLPSQLHTLFVDTVGFISDIPTSLIASFSATLEDAALADLVVHVRDVSHPDTEAQAENVLETLASLGVRRELLDNMLTVGNKIDKVEPGLWEERFRGGGFLPVSATEGFGLNALRKRLDAALVEATGRRCVRLRCRTGSEEFDWLRKNVTVSSLESCAKDLNFSVMTLLVTNADMPRFKKRFMLQG